MSERTLREKLAAAIDSDWDTTKWGMAERLLPIIRAHAAEDAVEPWREEVDSLKAKLAPSPCGVDGHRMVDWVPAGLLYPVGQLKQEGEMYCLACQREQRVREQERASTIEEIDSLRDAGGWEWAGPTDRDKFEKLVMWAAAIRGGGK